MKVEKNVALNEVKMLIISIEEYKNKFKNRKIINKKEYEKYLKEKTKLLKIYNFCEKAFIANNPKAEYDTPQYKNKANVYKSKGKTISRHAIHTDKGIAVKMPSKELSDSMINGLKKK